MLREYDDVEPVILSVGEDEEVSIREVADAIVKALDFKGDYTFDTTKADGQFRKPASNKKLLRLMGGFEFTPFTEGAFWFPCSRCVVCSDALSVALDLTVKWFLENYDTARTGSAGKKA